VPTWGCDPSGPGVVGPGRPGGVGGPGRVGAAPEVDLNSDLGEGFGVWNAGDDEGLLAVATSANVACGFHAGDPLIMRRVCASAAARGVAVGAHVGYPDLRGFGRREVDCPPDELEADAVYQIGALQAAARAAGTRVSHVKPHGALYHRAASDHVVAAALVDACLLADRSLAVVGPPHSRLQAAAVEAGLDFAAEGFADRAYLPDGGLVPRGVPGAVIHDPDVVVDRCLRMATRGEAVAVDGSGVALHVRTICVHGDTPGALGLAHRIRACLEAAGVAVRPFAPLRRPLGLVGP
jgi:5-oxoprolinase (ATP-hydrolysing) subunit A